ncbi:hypothetical protein ABDK56_10110 [Sphingomonas sp. ASV193]|uniref:hypothetical protein n=1 Tax=Sphingomonas sp. ASV193 TaxID=3144405 RepID=UPI0032E8D662
MKILPLALPALLLVASAGCHKAADPMNNATDNDAATPATDNFEVVPPDEDVPDANTLKAENAASAAENGTAGDGGPVMNSIHPIPGRAAPGAPGGIKIPSAFHGRWGLGRADCTSTRGDAKGLLTIAADQLRFYESRGVPMRVIASTATRFDARYAFSGEGQEWQRNERLALAGDRLQRRTDAERGQEPPVNLTYQRCA